ncbi:MAG: FAD-binding oxidoreductase [Gammaproteobacteria bacterium]|nr:FAD-binding oxidoreductase [Gammaproteobacteria bacterium]
MFNAYEQKKQRLAEYLRNHRGAEIRLAKSTSNLFRDRQETSARKLDVRDFNNVLQVTDEYVEVEGMTPYAKLAAECLKHHVMPAVVPQLKSITIGGATVGCGIESSSFRYGLVHETVQEMEILLGDGRIVCCTPENEHRDLFYGFPNSYGTLGYALKIKAKVAPVKPYVKLTHAVYADAKIYFAELARQCARTDVDFVDGVVFGRREMVITLGQFTNHAPYVSDYTYKNIYYRSLRQRQEDYLSVEDYLWRWDTDWFWCSKNLGAQNPLIRRLYGKSRLNSISYTQIMRWNSRWKLLQRFQRLLGMHAESVIQDVEVPIEAAEEFLSFYHETIRFTPVWICPTRCFNPAARFDLYPMDPKKLYVNFGFWDVIRGRKKLPPGFYNRQVETKVMSLGGIKSLYSDSYFTPQQFWKIYNKDAYEKLKQKYDPQGALKDIYRKCVQKE